MTAWRCWMDGGAEAAAVTARSPDRAALRFALDRGWMWSADGSREVYVRSAATGVLRFVVTLDMERGWRAAMAL